MRRFTPWLFSALMIYAILACGRPVSAAIELRIAQRQAQQPLAKPHVTVEAKDDAVVVEHLSVSYNCCYLADARVEVQEGAIALQEKNVGEDCESLVPCYFDITYTISRLVPGSHTVYLFDPNGTLSGQGDVEVDPIATNSQCLLDPPGSEKATIEATWDSIRITHLWAEAECCLDLAASATVEGSVITIQARDVSGAPCDCLCLFNLNIEIPGLAPGGYQVKYHGLDGKLVATADVSIEGPQVVYTQAALTGGAGAPWVLPPKSSSILVEGHSVVVEYMSAEDDCCLDFRAWAELKDSGLGIYVRDDSPPCACIGNFILRFEVLDLDPGTYRVTCFSREVVSGDVIIGGSVYFVRGVVSGEDWEITLSDAIQILTHLFLGSPEKLLCDDAADVNDDSTIDLTDAVQLLGYLFLGGTRPAAPFPTPGLDVSQDELGCEEVLCDRSKLAFELDPSAGWDFVEFCIPQGEIYENEVSTLYPEVKFLRGSHGMIGCRDDQVLCTIDWPDVKHWKLCWLTGLSYIAEIRGSHWE